MISPSLAQTIALGANGSLAGFSLCVSLVTIPSFLQTGKAVEAFPLFYGRAARFAISHVTVSTAANLIAYYYGSRDVKHLYAAALTAAFIPLTFTLLMPINRTLLSIAATDDKNRNHAQANALVDQWSTRQWTRTISSLVAFAVLLIF
ncbi:hypothetical protein BC940DRAFT_232392 [Gongronella butleri]|nr:hypothetical protein BC940DRAFT_232392 [Gongronella butleri]